MKVVYLTKWYPNKDNFVSGTFVHEFAKAVAEFCTVFILHVQPSDYNLGTKIYAKDKVKIRQTYYRKNFISYLIYNILAIKLLIPLIRRESPDLIHVHIFSAGIPAIFAKGIFRIPFVVTEHYAVSDGSFLHTYSGQPKMALKLKTLLARYVFSKADALINVSIYMEKELRHLNIKTASYTIPNAVDSDIFYFNKTKPINSQIKRILFVGGLSHQKGLELILQAVGKLFQNRSDFRIDIIGNGYMTKFYRNKAQEMNIGQTVNFHGAKTKQEIADFMRNSDFLILPSYLENLPCVILESLCCGLPVIATNVGGIPEIINETNGLLVPPGELDLLVAATEKMLDKFHTYDREKISKEAIKLYSYAVGKSLFDVYR